MNKLIALMVVALLAVGGCSGSDEPQPDVTTSSSVEQQAEALKRAQEDIKEQLAGLVQIEIKDGKVSPQGARHEVKVGHEITLKVTSDAAEELHVHSDPEHTFQVKAGDTKTFSFTIDTPGQVAVEAHHLGVTIVQLVVRP